MEVGTLKELEVKPGDVVEIIASGYQYIIGDSDKGVGCVHIANGLFKDFLFDSHPAKIVSRASDATKLWSDMTDDEKGALLLAHHEGKVIEAIDPKDPEDDWEWHPEFQDDYAYRVKPEPVRDTVTLYGANRTSNGRSWSFIGRGDDATHRITFDMIDGEPDCDSVKMEELY